MSAVVIDLATMRAVRRAARFRHVAERPAFRVALAALVRGAAPMTAYAKASDLLRGQGVPSPRGAA